jgi:shikimate dehydrogenase
MMKPVCKLSDLASRDLLDAGASKSARLAVLGWPIAHSASPQMHQAALDAHGIDARYIRLEVEPGKIPEAFARMRDLDFIGCNVTVPHKLAAMENCAPDHDAALLGAVNTIRFDENAVMGFNTDGPGFESAIDEDFQLSLHGGKVAVVGAGGGAGQAIATQCVISGVAKLVMVNRTVSKLDQLVRLFPRIRNDLDLVAISFDDPSLADEIRACDLIVNTSSVGLKPGDPSILRVACLKPEHHVFDTIYQPPVTPLLALAMEAGCRTSNGRSMLLHQGALAFQRWFPQSDPAAVLAAMRAALA